MNPMLANGMAQKLQPLKSALRGDPAAMMKLMGNNPQMAQVNKLVQESGGDARKAFYALAQKMGVNGDEIISMFK